MKKQYLHILSALAALGAASCTHKDLCFPEPDDMGRLNVVVDWGDHAKEWKENPTLQPKALRLFLYPKKGGSPLIYDFSDIKGGTLPDVPAGEYTAILVNNASDNIDFKQTTSAATFLAETPDAPLAEDLGLSEVPALVGQGIDKEVKDEPDRLWSDYQDNVDLRNIRRRSVDLHLSPDNMLRHYTVIADSVKNIDRLTMAAGSLSGMSASIRPADGNMANDAATLPFDIRADKDKRQMTGSFSTFGPADTKDDEHYVVIYVQLDNGNRAQLKYDVTEQVHDSPDPNNVVIHLRDIDLLATIPVGGGLNTSVDGWTDESVDLDM